MTPIVHPLKSRDDLPVHDADHRWGIVTLTTKTPTEYCKEKDIPECWGPLQHRIYILRDATSVEKVAAEFEHIVVPKGLSYA